MQLSIYSSKLLRGIILTAITIFIIQLKLSGELNFLVSPVIKNIIGVSIIPLCIISLITLLFSIFKFKRHAMTYDDHEHVHEHNVDDGHNHLDHKSLWYKLTIGLMFLFIILSFTWHPSTLGTSMISGQNSSIGLNNPALSSSTASSSNQLISTGGKGTSEAYIAFKYNQNPNNFIGKQFNLIGFVYHPNGLPKNQFILTRFFIFCCIADAIPIGTPVEISNAEQLKSDTWVQLSGTIKTENLPILDQLEPTSSWVPSGKNQPVLIANSIKAIPVPKQPYLVPDL
jgi:uncharacterized repeat protein (TIGR03943 family)